ncbi:MAG TPA: SIS domain-containing protein [Candidatus Angelobacter sp.]|nr:SIS domain-containing protein [Candidatus Angelobacter sp.]
MMRVAAGNPVHQFSSGQAVTVSQYFQALERLIKNLPCAEIDDIIAVLQRAFEEERTIFVFGNGGSASSASHMVSDMNKGVADPVHGRRMKVMSLTDNVPLLTACANDHGYETVFSEQLKNFVQPGDVAFAISCSGDSANVLLALTTARQAGAFTMGLAGFEGGAMKELCDICAVIPSDNMQLIEDVHHAVLHSMFTVLRERIRTGALSALTMAAGHGSK